MASTLLLTGKNLTRSDFYSVVLQNRKVELSVKARQTMHRSRRLVEDFIARKEVVYGVTTGVGSLSTVRIDPEQSRTLQLNVVRSHASGIGSPLTDAAVRGILLLRANGLATGYSGIRLRVAEMLCAFLNLSIHPVVPERGSVGASGDLAPLAHVAVALVGEGEVRYQGRRMSAARALKQAGLKPLRLEAKEGLSLVNGTQAMLALGLLALRQAELLADTADVAGALSLDALRGSPAAFDPRLHRARPHPGQMESARNLLRLNQGSTIRRSHLHCPRVQDAYSLRCMPQVHGAVRDSLNYCRGVMEVEMNSATDNPLVFLEGGAVISGGNFHGQPLAVALDLMAIVMTQLGGMAERRIDRMVNPLTSELPAFLTRHPGLESGLMIAQVTAAALASENKVLAHPASVDSIPTSGNKEDYVSMGMTAALKVRQVIENTAAILAIELMVASQALDVLLPLQTGRLARQAQARVRQVSKPLTADRSLHEEMSRLRSLVEAGEFAAVLHLPPRRASRTA
jgi:histidine ammonia-lyase